MSFSSWWEVLEVVVAMVVDIEAVAGRRTSSGEDPEGQTERVGGLQGHQKHLGTVADPPYLAEASARIDPSMQ